MDRKEELMLNHYKNIIENRLFDEYDIYGFLIFIRGFIKEFPNILEFSHLIAHRERNIGTVRDSIYGAIESNYTTIQNSKKIKGYKGIEYEVISNEFFSLGNKLGIDMTDDIILEIMVCIFSITQFSEYIFDGGKGHIRLMQGDNNILALVTSDNDNKSPLVCFCMLNGVRHIEEFEGGKIDVPVEAKRIDGKIKLVSESKVITEVFFD